MGQVELKEGARVTQLAEPERASHSGVAAYTARSGWERYDQASVPAMATEN